MTMRAPICLASAAASRPSRLPATPLRRAAVDRQHRYVDGVPAQALRRAGVEYRVAGMTDGQRPEADHVAHVLIA
jgi:hypothetical protein